MCVFVYIEESEGAYLCCQVLYRVPAISFFAPSNVRSTHTSVRVCEKMYARYFLTFRIYYSYFWWWKVLRARRKVQGYSICQYFRILTRVVTVTYLASRHGVWNCHCFGKPHRRTPWTDSALYSLVFSRKRYRGRRRRRNHCLVVRTSAIFECLFYLNCSTIRYWYTYVPICQFKSVFHILKKKLSLDIHKTYAF